MSVYDIDIKQLRKVFLKFHRTLYGKTVFLLAYLIPFLVFLMGCIFGVLALCTLENLYCVVAGLCFLVFLPAFILANIYFYTEIRKFCEHLDRKKSK